MYSVRHFAKHLVPNRVQLAYCFIIASLISLYWCRNRLLYLLTAGTETTNNDLHASFVQALNHATNNSVASFMSLAVFWALIGLVSVAIIYESSNVFVAAWNDYKIVTTYTKGQTFERSLIKTFIAKSLLIIGFIIVAIVSWKLFGVWHNLIVQPVHTFFSWPSIGKELAGFAGLVANLYAGWMWLLFLLPRFFARFNAS